jgi:metallo-beta-lactamase family protein
MQIKFCGAAGEVTGSSHLISAAGKKILLDCGMFQGNKDASKRKNDSFLFDPRTIDFVILSHAHIDHSGRLPRLVKEGFKGKIISTSATKQLAEALLLDTAHILKQDAEFAKEEQNKTIMPFFNEIDVQKTIRLFDTCEYAQKYRVSDGVWLTFFDAGHVLGSSIVNLEITEALKTKIFVFTGDLGRKYMPILNDPYQVKSADCLVIESTYASHLHGSFSQVKEELTQVLQRVIARNGKIIIPGFSFERTQEIVYILHEIYNEKKIKLIPIFVDSPLSKKITEVFDANRDYYDNETYRDFFNKKENPFYFEHVKYLQTADESKKLNDCQDSCIIISSSGMCEAGRIKHHLKNHMGDERNLILVVGFMAEGTRGRDIVEGKRELRLFGETLPLRAEVVVMNSFSAHADKLELLEYIKNISDLENIFVVHGEQNESAVMRDNIYNILKFRGKVQVPVRGETFQCE